MLIHHPAPANLSPGPHPILATTFEVISPAFLNPNHRIAPIRIWAYPAWTLTIPRGYDRWPMISDDCNSLLLLHTQAASPHQPAFDIYRRDRANATPVATISLDSLWTPLELDRVGKGVGMIYDSTPFWFTTGALAFSPDGCTLDYRTQWGDHLRIDLTSGAVTRMH